MPWRPGALPGSAPARRGAMRRRSAAPDRSCSGRRRIRPGHMEKCLAVAERWAAAHAGELDALVRALRRAGPLSEARQDAPDHAALLAGAPLHLPLEATLAALLGRRSERPCFDFGPEHELLADGSGMLASCSAGDGLRRILGCSPAACSGQHAEVTLIPPGRQNLRPAGRSTANCLYFRQTVGENLADRAAPHNARPDPTASDCGTPIAQ